MLRTVGARKYENTHTHTDTDNLRQPELIHLKHSLIKGKTQKNQMNFTVKFITMLTGSIPVLKYNKSQIYNKAV